MPYFHKDNFELYMKYRGMLSAIIEDLASCNFIILRDFNSLVCSSFETELRESCITYNLILADYERYGRQ